MDITILVMMLAFWVGASAIWEFVTRMGLKWSIPMGFVASVGVTLIKQFMMQHFYEQDLIPDYVWLTIYFSVVPALLVLAAVARSRYLKTRGQ